MSPDQKADTPVLFWRRRSWWRRSGTASGAHLIAHALMFVSGVLAARGLGPAGYGQVVLALAVAGFIMLFLDMTLEEALVYFGTRYREQGETYRLASLFKVAVTIDAALGLGALAIVVLASSPISRLVADDLPAVLIVLAGVQYLATTVDSTTGAALLVVRRPDLRAHSSIMTGATRVALVTLALAAGYGTFGVIAASAAAALAGSTTQAYLAYRFAWGTWPRASGPRPPLRRLVRFAAFASVTGSLAAGTGYVVPILIGLSQPAQVVGDIAVGMMPVAAASLATTQLRLAALPEHTALWSAGRVSDLRYSAVRFAVGLAILSVPVVAVGYLLMPFVLPAVFGSEFQGAVRPARLLLLAIGPQLVSGWLKMLPSAIGQPRKRTVVATLEFGATSVGVGLLTWWLGIDGAVIGYVGAQMLVMTVWIRVAWRALRVDALPRSSPRCG